MTNILLESVNGSGRMSVSTEVPDGVESATDPVSNSKAIILEKKMKANQVQVLLVTINVGTVFEDATLWEGWTLELQNLLQEKFRPNMVAFSFQV